MRVTKANRPGACEAIEAMFVFGPQRCSQYATFVTEEDGEVFYVCDRHITEARKRAAA